MSLANMLWRSKVLTLLLFAPIVAEGCPENKGCFQTPAGCTDDCTLSLTWSGISETEYEVELVGKTSAGGYVAFGLPTSSKMGPAPVIVCSTSFTNKTAIYWNTASYTSNPVKSSTDGLLETVNVSENSGTLSCTFKIISEFSVTANDDTTTKINLNENSYNIILASGNVKMDRIEHHSTRDNSGSQFKWGDNNDHLENSENKGHFQTPAQCTDNCAISLTWTGTSEMEYEVELVGRTSAGGYVAFGLPTSSHMGPAPVIVCSTSFTNKTAIYWNTASYASNPVKSSTDGLLETVTVSENNGTLSCIFKIRSEFSVTANDDTITDINLNENSFNIILASGSVNAGNITQHSTRDKSDSQFKWSDNNQFVTDNKYANCGKTRGCTGFPDGCVEMKNCSILYQWFGISETQYNMSLEGIADDKTYFAMGLSTDQIMGNDSVVACSSTGGVQMYWNVVGNSIKLPNSTVGMSDASVNLSDSYLRCTFLLDSNLNISVPNSNSSASFLLNSLSYTVMLAYGPIDNTKTITYHTNKTMSKDPKELFRFNSHIKPDEPKLDYAGCDEMIGCVGIPDGCIETKNCTNLVRWEGISQNQYEFNLSGESNASSYIAVGLSMDNKMGNDSVIACLGGGDVNLYWNTAQYNSVPVNQSTASLSNATVQIVDGIMNCSFIINAKYSVSVPSSGNIAEFDINVDPYHVMLANGPVNSNNLIQHHASKGVTEETMDLFRFNSFISSDIYSKCFDLKGCFGHPEGCITKRNCEIIATYKKMTSSEFQFEIGFSSSESSGYAAIGLSTDNKMGDDSVMACTIDNGKIDVNMYWNTGHTSSTILVDKYYGLSKITGEFNSGFVSCSFQRAALTNITKPDNSMAVFDVLTDKYFILIAKGKVNSANIIQKHTLTDLTGSAIDLGSYGPVARSAELMMKLHGIAMLVAWILCSNLGVFMARYYKANFQVMHVTYKWFPSVAGLPNL